MKKKKEQKRKNKKGDKNPLKKSIKIVILKFMEHPLTRATIKHLIKTLLDYDFDL